MYDIYFSCKKCGLHFSADDSDSGSFVECPDCNAALIVPAGEIIFHCSGCGLPMLGLLSMIGETFHCSSCGQSNAVPIPAPSVDSTGPDPEPEIVNQKDEHQQTPKNECAPDPDHDSHFMQVWGGYIAQAGFDHENASTQRNKEEK